VRPVQNHRAHGRHGSVPNEQGRDNPALSISVQSLYTEPT
jgi:hypothetical protein